MGGRNFTMLQFHNFSRENTPYQILENTPYSDLEQSRKWEQIPHTGKYTAAFAPRLLSFCSSPRWYFLRNLRECDETAEKPYQLRYRTVKL